MGLFEEQLSDVLRRDTMAQESSMDRLLGNVVGYLSEMSHDQVQPCDELGLEYVADELSDDVEHMESLFMDTELSIIETLSASKSSFLGRRTSDSTVSCSASLNESAGPQAPPAPQVPQQPPARTTALVPVKSRKRTVLRPISEPKQFKNWKNATPSKYCHSCGSVPRADRVVCKNLKSGTCRKVFCRPCIEKIYGFWGEEHAIQSWECTHCCGSCPVKAACRYYSRWNSKRQNKAKKAANTHGECRHSLCSSASQ